MPERLMRTYARLPVAFDHGDGAWLTSTDGDRYLDALSGIAVCNLGHAHPSVTAAIADQAGRVVHTSNLYRIPAQEALGEALCRTTGMDSVFFANSGAEANEAAIKLARRYGHERGITSPAILVADGAFHGRTLATLSATASRKAQAGFDPLVGGFLRMPYNDIEAVERIAENRRDVIAVFVEPIQGEGGVVIPDDSYLRALRRICDERGWLLMLDEVQSGVARTGRWLAQQHAGVVADVSTLAKALGNGVPIGACLARGDAAQTLQPGSHGSTFGGNPLACRAGQAVLDTIAARDLTTRAARLGEQLRGRFADALAPLEGVVSVRGRGLMLGIELDRPCTDLVPRALDRHLLINVTAERVVRLLPPLILTDAEAERIADTVIDLLTVFLAEPTSAGARG